MLAFMEEHDILVRPSESIEIPVSYLLKDLDAFSKVGVDVWKVLRAEGLDKDGLDPGGNIGLARYLDVVDAMLAVPSEGGAGLITGFDTSLKDHGILGYTMLASDNLLDAIRTWQRFYALFCWPFKGAFSQTDTEAILTIEEPERRVYNDRQRVFGIEMWMANWAAGFRDFFGDEPWFHEVRLAYPDPGYAELYEQTLRCPVRFGQPQSEIRFSRDYLKRSIIGANEAVHQFCEQQCQSLLAEMNAAGDLVDRIRMILLRKAGHFPPMDQIAERLHMSERSLRRKLEGEGTSYKEILGDVRMRLAGEYLKNVRMKTQEISDLLGYSEVAAFNRAFKRWYGVPPTTYREQQKGA